MTTRWCASMSRPRRRACTSCPTGSKCRQAAWASRACRRSRRPCATPSSRPPASASGSIVSAISGRKQPMVEAGAVPPPPLYSASLLQENGADSAGAGRAKTACRPIASAAATGALWGGAHMNERWRLFLAALTLGVCVGGGAATAADVDGKRIADADKEPGNWLSHGRTYSEQRFSPLKTIDTGNVGRLGLAWWLDIKSRTTRGVEATPIVVDG